MSDKPNNSYTVDDHWYLKRYPDVAEGDMSAAEHYEHHGRAEGRFPNAKIEEETANLVMEGIQFNDAWYRDRYLDVKFSNMAPLEHYLRYGKSEGRFWGPEDPRYKLSLAEFRLFFADAFPGLDDTILKLRHEASNIEAFKRQIPNFLNAAASVPALAYQVRELEKAITIKNQPADDNIDSLEPRGLAEGITPLHTAAGTDTEKSSDLATRDGIIDLLSRAADLIKRL